MAKKDQLKYECNNCGSIFTSWMGKCSSCGEWNTLVEKIDTDIVATSGHKLSTVGLMDIGKSKAKTRISSEMNGVDEVLGGGFVAGSINLIAGQPGIGKSTLLLQIACNASSKQKVLYISGEVS